MAKDITVFKRYEIKFRLSSEQRTMVEEALADRMIPDAHGQSTICNIYYDTPDFRLIRRSQEKPEYKEKIRLRSYGKVDGNGKVLLKDKAMWLYIAMTIVLFLDSYLPNIITFFLNKAA